MKILYVAVVSNQVSGGTAVMNRNLKLLRNIPGAEVEDVQVVIQSKVKALLAAFIGGNLTLDRKDENFIIKKIKDEKFNYVFLEGTINGHFAKRLFHEGIEFITFAHNVETILYKERLINSRFNPLELIKYYSVKYNEKRTIECCSKLVTLTKRDGDCFYEKFGRNVDSIIPISFKSMENTSPLESEEDVFCLFVGSNFFPNIEGMNWFIKNGVPHIKIIVKVVGTCCNGLEPAPADLKDRVEYLGLVEDLEVLYRNASIVIAPIFKGSGMKTKTIEAMSYGKTIIGTDECFQGIECEYSKIGALCNTATEFIDAINGYRYDKYNKYTASLFEKKYSDNAVQPAFNSLFAK